MTVNKNDKSHFLFLINQISLFHILQKKSQIFQGVINVCFTYFLIQQIGFDINS